MPTWVVTGGAGFIGCNAASALAERGARVLLVDDLSRPTAAANLDWLHRAHGHAVDFARVDIRDRDAVDSVFATSRGVVAVLHLAAQVAVTSSVMAPEEDFDINALGTFNVLEAVRTHAPDAVFLNASTNKVYGDLGGHQIREAAMRYVDVDYPGGIPESHALDPHSPYGCSKAAGELYTRDYARVYGLRTVSFRQSCIYGPRQFGIEDQGWVAWFVLAAARRSPLRIYGSGKQVRDLLHVEDLIALYLAAFERADDVAGSIYNVGGGPDRTLSLLELLERLDGPDTVTFQPARAGDQKVFVADTARARDDLDWHPEVPLDRGLAELEAWVYGHRDEASFVTMRG